MNGISAAMKEDAGRSLAPSSRYKEQGSNHLKSYHPKKTTMNILMTILPNISDGNGYVCNVT